MVTPSTTATWPKPAVGPADAGTVAQAARLIAIIGSKRCIGCGFGFR
jgi:hypothetical protein